MASTGEGVVRERLLLAQAGVLAHALVTARAAALPVLHIKGPAADHHGLRPPRVSADADVLVHPDAVDEVVRRLREVGWRGRESSVLGSELVVHSVTVIHPEWPCDIDVHGTFPGFLAAPAAVFEVLWQRREALVVAGVEVAIPDLSSAILIQALHALRTPAQTPRHAAELHRLLDVCARLPRAQREDVVALAGETGALDTARPFLETLGVALPAPTAHGVDPLLDEWRARVAADGVLGSQLWIWLARKPWRQRPAALWRILWPTQADFRRDHPETGGGVGPATLGRVKRLGRGMRQVPTVVRGRIAARRGRTRTSLLDGDS